MPCYYPKQAFLAPHRGLNGKQIVRFTHRDGYSEINLPCGKCMGCRVDRTQQWALRLVHESRFHDQSSFVTLTYDDKHLPEDYGVHKEHFQLFMRMLRQDFRRHNPDIPPLRYYGVGEYGEKSLRPHYHAIVFGAAFPDQKLFRKGKDPGKNIFTSERLTRIWGKGFTSHSHVTPANASYVAGYIRKKLDKPELYERLNPLTGEVHQVEREFSLMSLKPGIGRRHVEKYLYDIFPDDFCVLSGKEVKVPNYYYKVLSSLDPSVMETVRAKRKGTAQLPAVKLNSTKDRLKVREEVAASRLSLKSKGTL